MDWHVFEEALQDRDHFYRSTMKLTCLILLLNCTCIVLRNTTSHVLTRVREVHLDWIPDAIYLLMKPKHQYNRNKIDDIFLTTFSLACSWLYEFQWWPRLLPIYTAPGLNMLIICSYFLVHLQYNLGMLAGYRFELGINFLSFYRASQYVRSQTTYWVAPLFHYAPWTSSNLQSPATRPFAWGSLHKNFQRFA